MHLTDCLLLFFLSCFNLLTNRISDLAEAKLIPSFSSKSGDTSVKSLIYEIISRSLNRIYRYVKFPRYTPREIYCGSLRDPKRRNRKPSDTSILLSRSLTFAYELSASYCRGSDYSLTLYIYGRMLAQPTGLSFWFIRRCNVLETIDSDGNILSFPCLLS